MAKIRFKVSKKTRFMSHMFASACFIGLFIWGWDLAVSDVIAYLIVSVGFLLAIIGVAAILGLLLRLLRKNSSAVTPEDE